MRFRASTTTLLAAVLLVAAPASDVSAAGSTRTVPAVVAAPASTDEDGVTRPTYNEFHPDQRPLDDCLSSLPKPNCGSDARGGWAQTMVFLAIIAGLAFIAWRVVAGSRRAGRRADDDGAVTRDAPPATAAPDGDGRVP